MLVVSLTLRLVNDEAAGCRTLAGRLLKQLAARLPLTKQQKLIHQAMLWFTDPQVGGDRWLRCAAEDRWRLLWAVLKTCLWPRSADSLKEQG